MAGAVEYDIPVKELTEAVRQLLHAQQVGHVQQEGKLEKIEQALTEIKVRMATLDSALQERCTSRGKASDERDARLDEHGRRLQALEEVRARVYTLGAVIAFLVSIFGSYLEGLWGKK